MWETINEVLAAIDDFVWGVPLIVLILSGGLLLTIRTKVLQVRHLPRLLKWMIKNEEEGEGRLLPSARCVRRSRQPSEREISWVLPRRSAAVVPERFSGWW